VYKFLKKYGLDRLPNPPNPSAPRYYAACCAAMASSGQGDVAPLGAKERARWRKQALDWFRDELVGRGKLLQSGKAADSQRVQRDLSYWQRDDWLAGVRDRQTLEHLPEEERAEWHKLWAGVADTLKKAGQGGKEPAPK